ncbi:pyridoxal phosphate-dependent aminotransferase [Pedobacter sp. AW31-3R]|uniref:pyridoxal phosphate-dependent aminotransferase n=1 Tax=Pedobacter sp. AW31-3R TaxID=3445781 RepID=UPI003FA079A8
MANEMNRRKWIKASALYAGGVAFFSETFSGLSAKELPSVPVEATNFVSDEQIFLSQPPEIKARLFANENPFGPSEKAKKAIREAIDGSYRYSFNSRELEAKIIAAEGLTEGMVALSAGSSPLLLAIAMHFSKEGGSIVTADPSFDLLASNAALFGARIINVPLTSDCIVDLDAMEKAIDARTKLVYICNPNNPTATLVDSAKLKAFIERVSPRVTVLVDEAYIDYVEHPQEVTVMELVKKGRNVIVLRTFSKLYGFAGLRVGYMVAQPEMVKTLSKYNADSFSISTLSMRAALASYQDKAFIEEVIKKTAVSKQFLYDTLKKEGYVYIPSVANFVMFPIPMDGLKFTTEMGKRGVGLRNWKFNGKNWCRVSIGTMEEMKIFAEAFSEIA